VANLPVVGVSFKKSELKVTMINNQRILNRERRLKEVYYNPSHPAGLSTAVVLAAATKVPLATTRKWLQKQKTYTLHRRARKRYQTRKYYVNAIDDQWQMDLADMNDVKRENKGYRFILTVIDILSRYGFARPLKTKMGKEVAAAIKDIFNKSNRRPRRIQTDQGSEFYNAHVKRLLNDYDIELFSVKSHVKCAMVERWNRTIKTKLWKMFTVQNNHKWLDILPQVVQGYNHSKHRSIKMKPADVNSENAMDVWEHLYGKDKRHKNTLKTNIKKGDTVRISSVKGQFEKGYLPNWSREEFIVDDISTKYLPTMLSLKDYRGDPIEGKFYGEEVQKIIRDPDDDTYEVEKIIRRKRKDGEQWLLVKWLGYDNSFNSWIRKRDVTNVFNRNE